MKKISIVLIILFLAINIQAQAQESSKKLSRKEKKELKKKKEEERKEEVIQLIDSKKFIFEAYEIIDKQGNSFPANSSINFIKIDSNKIVFQIGSARKIGINGLGGVALEGIITKFDIRSKKKGSFTYIVMKVELKTGYYDIQLDISPSGSTRVTITSSEYGKIVLVGDINSFQSSRTIQGTTY
jgi:hypothetical protein